MHRRIEKKSKIRTSTPLLPIFCFLAGSLLLPEPALATQGHGGIEGVYAHQIAHVFFLISLGVLIYWLRQRGLVLEFGWRYIQYAAFFLILWNLDTILVHALDDQFRIIATERIGTWRIRITDSENRQTLEWVYYFAKLDHLLCVPAIVCLFVGLRRLLPGDRKQSSKGQIS
jgi:hypothetical protein